MLIAGCKGRIETIEMWFGFVHGEELQLVKYQMSISHSVLVACSKPVYRFVLFLAKACNCHLVPLLLLHWFPIDQLAPPCCAPDITSIGLKQELLEILIMM